MNAPAPAFVTRLAFARDDEIVIDRIPFRPVSRNTEGWILTRMSGEQIAECFTHAQLSRLAAEGAIVHNRGKYSPEGALGVLSATTLDPISALQRDVQDRVRVRAAFCEAFLELEREGAVQRTYGSIEANVADLEEKAKAFLQDHVCTRNDPAKRRAHKKKKEGYDAPHPRTLFRWVGNYEREGLSGLVDRWERSGNHTSKFSAEVMGPLMEEVRRFASPQRPTKKVIFQNVRNRFRVENQKREAEGLAPLPVPSREAVRRAIGKLDPFHLDIARLGLEAARRRHRPVKTGVEVTRPLERVEIDEYEIDLFTLLSSIGLLDLIDDEDRMRMGLDGSTQRWWVSAALCAASRCIVGLRLTRAPGSASSIETLHMCTLDKGQWADGVGALSPWHMAGTPEEVVTDTGPAFKAFAFRQAVADLRAGHSLAIAGEPHLRGRIERVFHTMAFDLLPRLSGRSFSNVVMRGDHDSEGQAALTLDDLVVALVRWVVDIYHNSPHEGLEGSTPLERWTELVETYGVLPPPDLRRRRLVFGTRLERTVGRKGIRVFGIWYQSEELQRWRMHAHDKRVKVRWYREDIGAIEVEFGGEWRAVPSLLPGLDGVHANVWLAAARRLRAAKKAGQKASDEIVLKAIGDIEALDATARARVNLVAEDWSAARLEREENNLLVGFDVGGETTAARPAQSGDDLGIPLETAADKPAGADAREKAGADAGAPEGAPAPDAAEATPPHRAKRQPGSGFRMED